MFTFKLSTLSAALGMMFVVPSAWGLIKPASFAAAMRKFPRYTPLGLLLTILATAWFLFYVSLETNQDFVNFKPFLYAAFGAVGVGTCIFVRDFLPVRGLAVLLLLAAKVMCDSAHLVESDWRLVIVTLAYLWVFAGMWFTISPWRLRDIIQWSTASESRTRMVCGIRLTFGLFVVALAFTAFRVS
ncbi:MAG: hypothetical protein QOF48_34 [Verrucomicrobiota bacterium]|jgi:hypothetical protein